MGATTRLVTRGAKAAASKTDVAEQVKPSREEATATAGSATEGARRGREGCEVGRDHRPGASGRDRSEMAVVTGKRRPGPASEPARRC